VGRHWPLQTMVCVQNDPVGQSPAPRTHGLVGCQVGVARQAPPHAPVSGHRIVFEHIDPVGHSLQPPTVHGICGGGVSMQRPSQGPVDGHGRVLGVQVDPVGQAFDAPTVHGDKGGEEVMQRPPQVIVWVQLEPGGQSPPPTTHPSGDLGAGVMYAADTVVARPDRQSNKSCWGFIMVICRIVLLVRMGALDKRTRGRRRPAIYPVEPKHFICCH
jgi:hypothetical protein